MYPSNSSLSTAGSVSVSCGVDQLYVGSVLISVTSAASHIYIYIYIYPFKEEALSLWSWSHDSEPPTGANASKQREWDTPIVEAALSSLLSSADEPAQGRLLAAQRKESGAWISAPPMSSLGLRMDNDTIRVAVGLRLGTQLCTPHPCVRCGSLVDSSGTHGLHCGRSAGRHPRHAAINDLVRRTLSTVGVPSILEPAGLFRADGRRVDGVTVIPWRSGRPLA